MQKHSVRISALLLQKITVLKTDREKNLTIPQKFTAKYFQFRRLHATRYSYSMT